MCDAFSTVNIQCGEPTFCRYLHVDQNNIVHVIVPIVGGDEVSVDNTCKSAMELQKFYGTAFNAPSTKNSAIHVFQRYIDVLDVDIWLIRELILEDSQALIAKLNRKRQINAYMDCIRVATDAGGVRVALAGSCPRYPASIARAIAESGNIHTILLSPRTPDSYLRFPSPAFSLARRPNIPTFRSMLDLELRRGLPAARRSSELYQAVFGVGELSVESPPSEEGFRAVHARIASFFESRGVRRPPFTYETLEALGGLLLISFDSLGELYEAIINAESIEEPVSSLFQTTTEREKVNIMAQAFIALICVHLRTVGYALDFGVLCDEHPSQFAQVVYPILLTEAPEDNLISFVEDEIGLPISHEARDRIKLRFTSFWKTVCDAPHYDEFLVYLEEAGGTGLIHQGCMGIHFGRLLGFVEDAAAGVVENDEITEAYAAFAYPTGGLALTHSNPRVSHSMSVDLARLYSLIANTPSPHRIAELLLMTFRRDGSDADKPLYTLLLSSESSVVTRGDWWDIKTRLLALMPDQESLDAFALHMGTVEVWFRISGYIARSIYTQVTDTISGSASQLEGLNNEDAPDKLMKALELLDITVSRECVCMSQVYDGYTVLASERDVLKIKSIHEERRSNFHLTIEIAIAIYRECAHRFGENSPGYLDMMSHNNCALSPVPHPHSNSHMLYVPLKIYKACLMLGVIIPRWTFYGYNGYIVTAGNPESIDTLEQIAQSSEGAHSVGRSSPPSRRATTGGRGTGM